jgi:hypothetical protein
LGFSGTLEIKEILVPALQKNSELMNLQRTAGLHERTWKNQQFYRTLFD